MVGSKKILFLITKGNWGGAQRYVFDLTVSLKSKGYDVTVGHGVGNALPKKLSGLNIKSFSFENLGRNINLLSDIRVFFEIFRILKRERPNVLHINSPKIGGLGALAGRLAGIKKIVYTAHGWYFNEDRSWLAKIITKKLSWLTIILSHQTIVIGEKEKQDVINWPFVKNKIVLIHNGIGNITFTPRDKARQILAQTCNLPVKLHSAFWLGTIGEFHNNKGHAFAITAISELKKRVPNLPFILIIIGDGEEHQKLHRQIRSLGLFDTIYLAGFVPDASRLLTAFDSFILPSVKEGLPYVLMEAGQAGLPVVASNVGAISDIIEDEETGLLVEPKNPNDLGQKISRLIANTGINKMLANNLRRKIFQDFNLEKMISETEKIYLK